MLGPTRSDETSLPAGTLFLLSLHSREAGLKWTAFAIAVAIHCALMLVSFPEFKTAAASEKSAHYVVVRKYIPPPPKTPDRQRQAKTEFTRRIPVPDLTPDDPEPIREPMPEIVPEPYPDDIEFLIGVPPPSGPPKRGTPEPVLAGVGGVTQPTRIESSYVRPEYPDIARTARMEGRVVLQAVIGRDGTVSKVEVLSCSQPLLGFEDAAIEAVRQWRYEPALADGRPVDVYFTILVDFELT
jgi:protein TonB